jgi:hypothetical protein
MDEDVIVDLKRFILMTISQQNLDLKKDIAGLKKDIEKLEKKINDSFAGLNDEVKQSIVETNNLFSE